jgi:hypothetical protein
MSTIPLWPLPPSSPPRAETVEERLEGRRAEGRARAAIRLRKATEANARLAAVRAIETTQRISEQREWLATHKPPTRSEIETLRGMFPNLQPKRKR